MIITFQGTKEEYAEFLIAISDSLITQIDEDVITDVLGNSYIAATLIGAHSVYKEAFEEDVRRDNNATASNDAP